MANAYTVLVIDDEPPILRFLRTSLAVVGHRVVTAEDAAGALTALTAEKPDIVILDLGLPDRSGFDVITEIRQRSPVPIIVLSARSDERSKVQALDLGADDYIGKPFRMAELMARIGAAFASQISGARRVAGFHIGRPDNRFGPPAGEPCRLRGQALAQGVRAITASRRSCR